MNITQYIPKEVEEYSWTKLSTFWRCNRRAFLRYIVGEKDWSTFFAYGKGVHKGMEADNLAKVAGERLALARIVEAGVAQVEEEKKTSGLALDKDAFAREYAGQLEVYEKTGIRERIRPVPNSVEAPFRIHLEVEGVPAVLVGYVDLLSYRGEHETPEVVDYKRQKRPVSAKELAGGLQFEIYEVGAEAGARRAVTFVAGGRQKATCKTVGRAGDGGGLRESLIAFLDGGIRGWRAALRSGVWPRCDRGSFWCGAGVCPYHSKCYPDSYPGRASIVKVEKVGVCPPPDWKR